MTYGHLPKPVGRQREVLYLPAQGHTVVLGAAGSGKTTLAILRSLYLSDPSTAHGGRTLLVTFNRCLVRYMQHLGGVMQRPIDVRNYHRFARGYLASLGRLPWGSICDSAERLRLIESVVGAARAAGVRNRVSARPAGFLDEEFRWIQKHGIGTAEEYIDAERAGRTTRVVRGDRAHLFGLYERYLDQRKAAGRLYDWDDLASAVRRGLAEDDRERRYRHVVVDEGQDFSPEMLRSLAAAVPGVGSVTFFGDVAQQIYGHRISWRSAGLNASKIWCFQDNYRNTKQVARLALALAAMPQFPDDPDLVEPTAPTADGPAPRLVRQSSEAAELRLVATRAIDLARTGTVAILLRARDQESAWRPLLGTGATRLHGELGDWPTGPGLFYGTYHAAKGLEFDTVFMPFLSAARWPHPPDVEAVGQAEASVRDSRLLYVGITRARSTLVLTYTGELTGLLPNVGGLYQS